MMNNDRKPVPPILAPAQRKILHRLQRRLLLRSGLSLGALTLLTGCNLQDGDEVDKALWAMSRFNDRVQSWLFSGQRMAQTYRPEQMTRPFPLNAFYSQYNVPAVDIADYRLAVSGRVADKSPWTLDRLRALPQQEQITRLICIEVWSAIGSWRGVPLKTFLERVGADMRAAFVAFRCADRYYSSLDMATALHPQTTLALDFAGQTLPDEYGFPLRLRVPTKLGFKNAKHIVSIAVTNDYPGGYWEDQGYNWFSGI